MKKYKYIFLMIIIIVGVGAYAGISLGSEDPGKLEADDSQIREQQSQEYTAIEEQITYSKNNNGASKNISKTDQLLRELDNERF